MTGKASARSPLSAGTDGTRAALGIRDGTYTLEGQVSVIQSFPDGLLDSVARTLGEALTGTIISNIFSACRVQDQTGESTKWKRLYFTFRRLQHEDACANRVGMLIEAAMEPSRWSSAESRARYHHVREELNTALVMVGIELNAGGKLQAVRAAATLDEAHERVNRLRATLRQRGVHAEVLTACSTLILKDDNYFHAAFEVTKSIAERLRSMAGSKLDGNELIDATLECGSRPFPIVALNRYDSQSLKNEQRGVALLARGLFHAFRNVTAHVPATVGMTSEQDALDMISTASLIHRRLDTATVTTQYQPTT